MRWFLLVVPVVAVSSVFACGGGGDEITEEEAEDIAEAALLAITHLPGTGWQETARDEVNEDDDAGFPETAACEALNELISETDDEDDDELVTTNVTFERAARSREEVPLEVQAEIVVHEGTAPDEDLADRFNEVLDDARFHECMEDFVAQAAQEIGGRGEYRQRAPSADAPEGGAALSFGFIIEVQDVRVEAAGEMYFWNDEHVESQLFFFGPPELLREDQIEEILEESQDRVRAAQE